MSTQQVHYQQKFITLDEAIADAKKQSVEVGLPMNIIQVKSIYYVDTNGIVKEKEILHARYENGKKVKI